MIIQVSRGAAVKSAQEAIARGLHLPNGYDKRNFPGLFFYAHSTEPNTPLRTTGAEQLARDHTTDDMVGVVVAFPITRENFSLLRNRVFMIKEHNGVTNSIPVNTFDLLEQEHDELVVINLEGLGEERLNRLNATVGISGRDGTFRYATYQEYQRSCQEHQRRDQEHHISPPQEYQRRSPRGLFSFSSGLRFRL